MLTQYEIDVTVSAPPSPAYGFTDEFIILFISDGFDALAKISFKDQNLTQMIYIDVGYRYFSIFNDLIYIQAYFSSARLSLLSIPITDLT